MRKMVKITAGWIHATLILAILLPVFYALGLEQKSGAGQTLYFRCLLIAFPVVATDIAVERCKGLFSYLVISAGVFVTTGILGWFAAGTLHQSGEAVGYLAVLLVETLFLVIVRLVGRLHKKREKEAMEKEDPDIELYKDIWKEPSFIALLYFFLVYVLALHVNSPEVCNEALFSAAVYGVIALLYHYVSETETYLVLNKRTCNLPSRRIYGIGSGMLAIFLLLLMIAVIPSFLTISRREYRDVRNGFENWDLDFTEMMPGGENIEGGGEVIQDWAEIFGEPKPPPIWAEVLFYVIGVAVFLLFLAVLVKTIRDMFRDFRKAGDENGDIVEELEEVDTEYKRAEVRKGRERRSLSERERIRKQYRKFIRAHRKDRPAVYESPMEIEAKAGVAQSEEGMELHGRYEYVRYGGEME